VVEDNGGLFGVTMVEDEGLLDMVVDDKPSQMVASGVMG